MNATELMHERERIKRAALQRAQALRREAMDDFWRAGAGAWNLALASACRSAERLARRLARHQDRSHNALEG